MKKNLKLIVWPMTQQKVKVELTPLGDKIKFRIVGKVFCSRMNMEMPKSGTYRKNDLVWNAVFGSRVETAKFLKKNRKINKVMTINLLGYDYCDSVR